MRLAIPTAILTAVLIFFGSWQAKLLLDDRIYAGVRLDNISLGQMSRAQAQKTIEDWWIGQQKTTLSLSDVSTLFIIRPEEDIGFSVDAEAMTDAAYQIGRKGTIKNRLIEIYRAKKTSCSIPLIIRYNEVKLENILYKLQIAKNKPPRNVLPSLLSGKITPEEWGRKLDVELLKKQIVETLYQRKNAKLDLPLIPIAPEMTAADLDRNGLKELMSSYHTFFNNGDFNRSSNIKLAAEKINGCLLFPGQTFSFNETVGPRDKDRGFREALEIVDGEFVPGIGGGVCQVSSTLYNAVLLAGLSVTERSNHSRPLRYVPLGRDATVAYGSIDFKFVNNNLLPIMILSETSGGKLYVGILGKQFFREHSEAVSFEIITTDEKTISPSIIEKRDNNLPQGIKEIDKTGSPGYEVSIIRVARNAYGHEIKREILSIDNYLPDNEIVRIGQSRRLN